MVFIVLVFYLVVSYSGLLDIPKLKAGDIFFRARYKAFYNPKRVENIVIVSIGDSTYRGRWPWDRDVFADLVYKLERAKPSVIGFDLGFIEKGASANDFLFAEAIKDSGNVVLASYIDKEGRYIMPQKDFRERALGYGFTNKPEDIDNVIRETKVFQRHSLTGEIIDYSFDFKIASAFSEIPLDEIPIDKEGELFINYAAGFHDFNIMPIEDVLEDRIPLDFVRDKIVLIGVTDEIFHDISFTPFGKMPGVSIIANTISMLISKDFMYEVPNWLDVLILILFGLLVGIVTTKGQIFKGLLLTLIILGVFVGISMILIMNNIIWDFLSVPLVILGVYIVNTSFNYAELLMHSFRIKKAVTTDILAGLPTRRYFLLRLERELKRIRPGEDISLVIFSIDNFSGILEELGGDRVGDVIKGIADEITRCSRKTRGVDFIARYGETEFSSVLHRAGKKGASAYADRVRKAVSSRIKLVPSVTMSAGIADIMDVASRSSKAFTRCAEVALTRARQEGFEKACIYDPKLDHIDIEEIEKEKPLSEVDLSYAASEFEEKNKELAILVNKLRIAHEDVIKSERLSAVGKVAATIHHDLSKPIINLMSSLKMIKEDIDKLGLSELETAKKLLTSAVEEIDRLHKLSDSLKDLYRPVPREVSPISINPVLEEMLGLSSAQIAKNKIRLVKNLEPNLPMVMANAGELKQVFLNLIINAIEAMPAPAGGDLEVGTRLMENMVEVIVRDTGCGIAPENIDKLFKAFFTTKKLEKGAGLGLYASREIIKRYGGKITAESKLGQGSVFKVYLPSK